MSLVIPRQSETGLLSVRSSAGTHMDSKTHTCMHSTLALHIWTDHTPWYVKPFHLVHLYVQDPLLSKQLWLCVFAWKKQSERGIKTRGPCMYALERESETETEREARAVWSRLCDKPLKYQMGGRAKQPTVHYDRERERERERETERERERETERERDAGSNISLDLLFYLTLLSYSNLLIYSCEAWSRPIMFGLCQPPAWRGGRKTQDKHKGFSPFPPMSPLWIYQNGTVFSVWFLLLWEQAINKKKNTLFIKSCT